MTDVPTHRLLLLTKPIGATGGGGVEILSRRLKMTMDHAAIALAYLPVGIDRGWANRLHRWRCEASMGFPFYARASYDHAPLRHALESFGPTVVMVEHLELLSAILDVVPEIRRRGLPVVAMSHGLHSLDFFYFRSRPERLRDVPRWLLPNAMMGRMQSHESRLMHAVDAVWTLNPNESEIARWLGAPRTFVLPQACIPEEIPHHPVRGRFGFVGTLNHPINADGLDRLIDVLAGHGPQTGLELRVVGGPPPRLKAKWSRHAWVQLLGRLSDEQLHAELPTWSAMIHPLFHWAKGRSLKVTTAMEWGMPFISSRPGVRGYTLTPGEDYLCADDPGEMAERIIQAAGDPAMLEASRERMRSARDSRHSVTQAAHEVTAELRRLMSDHRPQA